MVLCNEQKYVIIHVRGDFYDKKRILFETNKTLYEE
jgi:hypothetical protein